MHGSVFLDHHLLRMTASGDKFMRLSLGRTKSGKPHRSGSQKKLEICQGLVGL
jgi:hypothetical protein